MPFTQLGNKFNVTDSTDTELLSYSNEYEFFDINLKNNIVYTFNKNQGFTSISHVNILNVNTNSLNEYSFKGSIKSLFANEEKLAINTGSEVHFIGLNGWLIKKYDSYSEINNVILGDSIAGIVCKDKIKILSEVLNDDGTVILKLRKVVSDYPIGNYFD